MAPHAADDQWTVDEVRRALRLGGDSFYISRPGTGQPTPVEAYTCPVCDAPSIRSQDGGHGDTDLERLPTCRWRREER
jgi:hypothetical protein